MMILLCSRAGTRDVTVHGQAVSEVFPRAKMQLSGKTCSVQGFHSHGGASPKTGQAGGLP